ELSAAVAAVPERPVLDPVPEDGPAGEREPAAERELRAEHPVLSDVAVAEAAGVPHRLGPVDGADEQEAVEAQVREREEPPVAADPDDDRLRQARQRTLLARSRVEAREPS